MEQVMFFVFAIGAVSTAVAVVMLRSAFYSVLALVVHLVMLAGLFLLLRSEFLAATQIVVYAGAVMVLYVFVSAYIGNVDEPLWEAIPGQRLIGPLFAAAIFVQLSIAVAASALKGLGGEGAPVGEAFGSPQQIGTALMEKYLVAFEGASILLMLASVGAVILGARRRSTEPELALRRGEREPEGST